MVWSDSAARGMFEYFIAEQFHIEFTGIWTDVSGWVVGVSADQPLKARNGQDLAAWINENRLLAQPCRLHVGPVPEDASILSPRTEVERALGYGSMRTQAGIWHDLASALSPTFPDFIIWSLPGRGFVEPVRELSADEQAELSQAIDGLGLHLPLPLAAPGDYERQRQVQPQRESKFLSRSDGIDVSPMQIASTPRAHRKRGLGHNTLEAVERDHDLWSGARESLWNDEWAREFASPTRLRTKSMAARVYVPASVFPPVDLRVLLPMYETIILAPPIAESEEGVLKALGATTSEIATLARAGRIEIALPFSFERYSPGLLEELTEAAGESVFGPRELALGSVLETRNRVPMLLPASDLSSRVEVLRALGREAQADATARTAGLPKFIEILSRCWGRQEELVAERGLLGLAACGIGRLVGEMYQEVTGQDLWMEFGSAANSVEVAAVVGATVCPATGQDYDEYGHTKVICTVFDGFVEQLSRFDYSRVEAALQGLLGIGSEIPILELADSLSGSDIRAMHELLAKIATEPVDPTDFQATIERYNREVQSFAGRRKVLKKLDLSGLLAVTAGFIGLDQHLAAIPAAYGGALWITERLRAFSGRLPLANRLADGIQGVLTAHRPRTTLIARLRDGVSSKRE